MNIIFANKGVEISISGEIFQSLLHAVDMVSNCPKVEQRKIVESVLHELDIDVEE